MFARLLAMHVTPANSYLGMTSGDDKISADHTATATAQTSAEEANGAPPQDASGQATEVPENRLTLLAQAKEFLASPAIRHQDEGSKREFLSRKGVASEDIEALLSEGSVSTWSPS